MTPETRYKIFAPYIGCEISGTRHEEPATGYLTGLSQQYGDFDAEIQWIEGYHTSEEADFKPVNEVALLVRPLSSITDEDAVEVAKIVHGNPDFHNVESGKYYINKMLLVEDRYSPLYFSFYQVSRTIDFLRSKGYAMPYLDWSVDELLEAGVYKLQNQ